MRKTETQSLGNVISQYLKEMNIDNKIKESQAIQLWQELMGIQINKATKSIYFKDHKMIVSLTSSVVRNEVMMMRSEIKSVFNKKLGNDFIKEIIVH